MLAINTEEFREFTQVASDYNDTIAWTVSGAGVTTMTGAADVNDLHADFFSSWFLGTPFLGYGSVHARVLGVVPASTTASTVNVDLQVTNIYDGDLPTTALIALLPIDQGFLS